MMICAMVVFQAAMAFAAPGTSTVPNRVRAHDVTAEDQSPRPSDVETTRRIRVALMKEKLSVAGKNVTVVTRDGKVILKGSVPAQEVTRITGIARGIAGAVNVTNEMKIAK